MRFVAVLFALILVGCDKSPQGRSVNIPADLAISKPVASAERFLQTNSPDIAFDAKTGSLCKTWDWRDQSVPFERNLGMQLSTCERLYRDDLEQQARLQRDAIDQSRAPK